MRRALQIAALGLICFSLPSAAGKSPAQRSSYADGIHGFSMSAPRFPGSARGMNALPVIFNGPAENGFANNVHVMIQPMSMTRKAYRDLSLRQFAQAGSTLISEKNLTVSGRPALLLDFTSESQGRPMRHLALAVIDTHRVFLITGTELKESFKRDAPAFRACLLSFKIP
jgi:hypothetical protein